VLAADPKDPANGGQPADAAAEGVSGNAADH
jgi:hypothetical protein